MPPSLGMDHMAGAWLCMAVACCHALHASVQCTLGERSDEQSRRWALFGVVLLLSAPPAYVLSAFLPFFYEMYALLLTSLAVGGARGAEAVHARYVSPAASWALTAADDTTRRVRQASASDVLYAVEDAVARGAQWATTCVHDAVATVSDVCFAPAGLAAACSGLLGEDEEDEEHAASDAGSDAASDAGSDAGSDAASDASEALVCD